MINPVLSNNKCAKHQIHPTEAYCSLCAAKSDHGDNFKKAEKDFVSGKTAPAAVWVPTGENDAGDMQYVAVWDFSKWNGKEQKW